MSDRPFLAQHRSPGQKLLVGLLLATTVRLLYNQGAVHTDSPQANCNSSGAAEECFQAGLGQASRHNYREAAALFDVACRRGSPQGCNTLGVEEQLGRGVVKDLAAAERHFNSACAADHPVACANLGLLLLMRPDASDVARGRELLAKSCVRNEPAGCYGLYLAYIDGLGVEKNPATAFSFAEDSCKLGHGPACYATWYELKKSPSSARRREGLAFLSAACFQHHHPRSCWKLSAIFEASDNLDDLVQARQAYREACKLDSTAKDCADIQPSLR